VVFDDSGKALPLLEQPPSQLTVSAPIDGPWRARIRAEEQPELEIPRDLPARFSSADGVDVRLEDWSKWGLPQFSGRIDYECMVDGTLSHQRGLVLDLGRVAGAAGVWINGEPVGERLWPPHRFPIRDDLLVPGKNTVRVRVANNVGNAYGMELESGLFGPVVIGK
jgi:hypothetical protein